MKLCMSCRMLSLQFGSLPVDESSLSLPLCSHCITFTAGCLLALLHKLAPETQSRSSADQSVPRHLPALWLDLLLARHSRTAGFSQKSQAIQQLPAAPVTHTHSLYSFCSTSLQPKCHPASHNGATIKFL